MTKSPSLIKGAMYEAHVGKSQRIVHGRGKIEAITPIISWIIKMIPIPKTAFVLVYLFSIIVRIYGNIKYMNKQTLKYHATPLREK